MSLCLLIECKASGRPNRRQPPASPGFNGDDALAQQTSGRAGAICAFHHNTIINMPQQNAFEPPTHFASRREFLWNLGGGLGGIALASLLGHDGLLGGPTRAPSTRALHHPAKAKRVVQLYMSGAASQCDL